MIRTNARLGVSAAALAVGLPVLLLWAALPVQAQSTAATSTITVNTKKDETTPDDDRCSLREAIQNANDNARTSPDCNAGVGEDAITFKTGLSGTITLNPNSGPLTVTDPAGLTINGGKDQIIVSGGDKVQVFSVSQGATLAVKRLTVANGFANVNDPNSGGDRGGGILNDGGTLTVTRSTFSGNSALNFGGGIANINGGTLTVTYSTFSGNDAEDVGGGISNAIRATATLSNTVLANSVVQDTRGGNCGLGTFIDGGYNISDDSSCAFAAGSTSKNSTDPELDPDGLENNGGPTQTIALQKGSPAVDYIPEGQNGCGTATRTDQRGVKRPQGKTCDVGAYESKQAKRNS